MSEILRVGDTVPDFEVDAYFPDRDELGKFRFTDYRGKWVVMLFYPADFTFVCPTELEDAAEFYKQFKEIGAEIVSISTDTHFVHKAWHDQSPAIAKVKYPMLGDPAGRLCKLFGTYLEDEGLSLRGTFIVNPEGRLVALEIHSNDIGRNIEEIYRKVLAAKYVAEHQGRVCPARWRPGEKDLAPTIKLIGKI